MTYARAKIMSNNLFASVFAAALSLASAASFAAPTDVEVHDQAPPVKEQVGEGKTRYWNHPRLGMVKVDAAGYVFWSDRVIELDAINPQVAARLARALDRWKKLADPWRSAAREAIARVAAKPDLSNDVREVVTRALAD